MSEPYAFSKIFRLEVAKLQEIGNKMHCSIRQVRSNDSEVTYTIFPVQCHNNSPFLFVIFLILF